MTDYSQHGEQGIILEAVGQTPGRFLDIGACHPTQLSNTRALYELGWSGVMIEASPGPMRGLLTEYGADPRITLVQAAVAASKAGQIPRFLEFHITDGMVSTADDRYYERWKQAGGFVGKVLIPCISLGHILHGINFEFVNIDVEGGSADLFLEMLALRVHPVCCCVEHDDRQHEIVRAATAHGYRCTEMAENIIVFR